MKTGSEALYLSHIYLHQCLYSIYEPANCINIIYAAVGRMIYVMLHLVHIEILPCQDHTQNSVYMLWYFLWTFQPFCYIYLFIFVHKQSIYRKKKSPVLYIKFYICSCYWRTLKMSSGRLQKHLKQKYKFLWHSDSLCFHFQTCL